MKLAPPNNIALPELNGFAARSFWLQLLTVVAMILNSQGIDIFAALREAGLGGNPQQVLATGDRIVSIWQQALPIVTGIWAYLERRAPHYRLVWPWNWGTAMISGALVLSALMASSGVALAQGTQCGDRAAVMNMLADKYGEQAVGGGIGGGNRSYTEVFASPETGTWTIVVTIPNGMTCLVASGQGWTLAPQPVAEGDPT